MFSGNVIFYPCYYMLRFYFLLDTAVVWCMWLYKVRWNNLILYRVQGSIMTLVYLAYSILVFGVLIRLVLSVLFIYTIFH